MTDKREAPRMEAWHVGREIPLAMIVTFAGGIILQSFGFGYWMADTRARVARVEDSQAAIEKKLEPVAQSVSQLNERTVRMEEKVSALLQSINDVRALILRSAPAEREQRR